MKTNLIIDGNNIANCAYFKSGFEDDNWNSSWAANLFDMMLSRISRELHADKIFIAWDGVNGSNWRKAMLSDYKADRKKEGREKLIQSIDECRSLRGYKHFCYENFEGDDVVYGLCKVLRTDNPTDFNIVVSADKDFIHLIQRKIADKLYNPLTKDYREIPLIDNVTMRAIAGNDDNLKGLPGKGPKFVEKYVKGLVSLTDEEQELFEKHKLVVDLELNPYKEELIKNIQDYFDKYVNN